jgi:dolichol-phosphate mannosyltransferase
VIEPFLRALADVAGPGWEILVVDDGSADATPAILSRLVDEVVVLRVVTHERNQGLGAALRTGFAAARGDVVVTMDADLSHPISLLPAMIDGCGAADAVFASRFVPGGGMAGVPAKRRLISVVGNLGLRLLFRSRVRDLTTGFRAYRTAVVRDLDLRATGFEIQLEIALALISAGRQVAEVPLMLGVRAAGASKMRYLPLVPRYWSVVRRWLPRRWLPGRSRAGPAG